MLFLPDFFKFHIFFYYNRIGAIFQPPGEKKLREKKRLRPGAFPRLSQQKHNSQMPCGKSVLFFLPAQNWRRFVVKLSQKKLFRFDTVMSPCRTGKLFSVYLFFLEGKSGIIAAKYPIFLLFNRLYRRLEKNPLFLKGNRRTNFGNLRIRAVRPLGNDTPKEFFHEPNQSKAVRQ